MHGIHADVHRRPSCHPVQCLVRHDGTRRGLAWPLSPDTSAPINPTAIRLGNDFGLPHRFVEAAIHGAVDSVDVDDAVSVEWITRLPEDRAATCGQQSLHGEVGHREATGHHFYLTGDASSLDS
jgi:hypothetical protein